MTEDDEIVGWHHRLKAREFEQPWETVKDRLSLACCSPCGRRVRHD